MKRARWTCCAKRVPEPGRRPRPGVVRAGTLLFLALAVACPGGRAAVRQAPSATASEVKLAADVVAGLYHAYEKIARVVPADVALFAGIVKAYSAVDLLINVGKAARDTYRYLSHREVSGGQCVPVAPERACRDGDETCMRCARRARRGVAYAWGWIQKVIENAKETADFVSSAVIVGDFGSTLPLWGNASIFAMLSWQDQRRKIGAAYERYADIYRNKLAEFLYDLDETYWKFSSCLATGALSGRARLRDVLERSFWYVDVGHPNVLALGDCYGNLPYHQLSVKLEFPRGSWGWRSMLRRGIPMPALPAQAGGRGLGAPPPAPGEAPPAGEGPVDLLGDGGTGTGAGPVSGSGGPGTGPGQAEAEMLGRRLRRCPEAEGTASGAARPGACREAPGPRR